MIRMKNLDRITGIKLRIEFKCAGRIAFVEAEIHPDDLDNPAYVQAAIDESVGNFVKANELGAGKTILHR